MKNNATNPQLSQLSYKNRTVPFMLGKITKTLSNSFHKMIRRNSAASVCSGLAWLTYANTEHNSTAKVRKIPQQIAAKLSWVFNSIRKMLMLTTAKRDQNKKK